MARRLLQQLTSVASPRCFLSAASPRRFLSCASSYVRITLDELMADEPSESTRSKLMSLKALWEETEKTAVYAHQVEATLILELLRAKALDNTLGLFEFLQQKILDKHPHAQGRRGSEAAWAHALRCDPDLETCLHRHLGPSANLPAHLVALYHHLSQHVHARKGLGKSHSTIIFQSDFLSPEQCSSLVCLGSAVGVNVEPATPRSIATSLFHTSSE